MRGSLALRRRIPELLVFLALLILVSAQASTPEELLDELGAIPGISIAQMNDTAWMLVISPNSCCTNDGAPANFVCGENTGC
jgi:hypothetical protein